MSQTPRELVKSCLEFETPERIPRDVWILPWAQNHYRAEIEDLLRRYPSDLTVACDVYRPSERMRGDPYVVGEYTDEWGCVFTNIQAGVQGEICKPIISDLSDFKLVKPPYETLPAEISAARDKVNRFCAGTDRFVRSGCCPRPWERYQFLRGSENAMIDLMLNKEEAGKLLKIIHDFYLAELEFWVSTDVDAISFMDDWGSQTQLLIPPGLWRELFKPLYRDYCEFAHAHGKYAFMHCDGQIMEIYPDLIEVGVDALNSQLFCMDMEKLSALAKGKITFWGEMDRQYVMAAPDPQAGRDAVRKIARQLYDPAGGIIAQFELGPACNPAVAFAVFEEWDKVEQEYRNTAS